MHEIHQTYLPAFEALIRANEKALLLGCEMNADFATWERERAYVSEPITEPGTILDFGCANGFLLRTLQEWTGLGDRLVPYGVDTNSEHIKDAQQLYPDQKDHFYTSDQFLQTPIDARPKKLQGPFDYVYWNVWDNLPVSANSDDYFKGYFTNLLAITKDQGKLIMGFYQANQDASREKIAHINTLLNSENFQKLGILHANVLENPQGVQMAMIIEKGL